MSKKKLYCVLDCETASLSFIPSITQSPEERKKLAIAKPLVYDIGWTITTRKEVVEEKQFLIAETFAVPSIFNTAYYAEKRPIYLEKIERGEIVVKPWDEVMKILIADLKRVDFVAAYNAMFDFKKAIPFTERYIRALYSPNYQLWEEQQKESCSLMLTEKPKGNPSFDSENFNFRGEKYPMFDIWGMACQYLINTISYKRMCLANDMLSPSGEYFKTSAESTYRYLLKQMDFDEAHTALEDARIESKILHRILHDHGAKAGIDFFPFKNLGSTVDFLKEENEKGKADNETIQKVIDIMKDRLPFYDEKNPYRAKIEKNIAMLMLIQNPD